MSTTNKIIAPRTRGVVMAAGEVRAFREGRKTQFRRVVTPAAHEERFECGLYHPSRADKRGELYPAPETFGIFGDDWDVPCPFGKPGESLYVKEFHLRSGDEVMYEDDDDFDICLPKPGGKLNLWRRVPAHQMRQDDSRFSFPITEVRVQRVQDATFEDFIAEGLERGIYRHGGTPHIQRCDDGPDLILPDGRVFPPVAAFHQYFDMLQEPKCLHPWEGNPWVWAVTVSPAAALVESAGANTGASR